MTSLTKRIVRQTLGTLDDSHGPDRDKRLVVAFTPSDLVTLKPARAKVGRTESVSLFDLYRWALRCRVNAEVAAKQAARRETQSLAHQRAAFTRSIKRGKL